MHGGKAPQVAARREARLAEARARLAGDPIEARDPADALVAAAVTADELAQRLRRDLLDGGGELRPAALLALGDWLDRVGRLSKAVVDARIDERKARVAEAQALLLVSVIRAIFADPQLALTPEQFAASGLVASRHLRAVAELGPGGDGA
jgi:hypothetical protein